jgi:hypothetical protein
MDTTEKVPEKTEEELMLEALRRLNKHEDFIVWREKVAKPLLTQWENELAKADELPEVILRANLKQLNTLKALFYTWFENIK